jgi:hypothetical protein
VRGSPALLAAIVFPFAVHAAAEMVEVEIRFYEARAGQIPNHFPLAKLPGRDPSGREESASPPGVVAIAGVFTSEQAERWKREIKSSGAKLLDRQKIAVLSGHHAHIQNVRELSYPTEFDTSKIPGDKGLYPTAFETRGVGSQLELQPAIGSDGHTIGLKFNPRVVEFQGFVDATQIPKDASPEKIQELLKIGPKKGSAWQPVFNSRELSTEITVIDGQSVLLNSPAAAKDVFNLILVTARILRSP